MTGLDSGPARYEGAENGWASIRVLWARIEEQVQHGLDWSGLRPCKVCRG